MSRRGTTKVGTGTIGDALAWLRKSKELHADAMSSEAWDYEAHSMWVAAEPIIKAYVNQLPVDASEEIARLTRERDIYRDAAADYRGRLDDLSRMFCAVPAIASEIASWPEGSYDDGDEFDLAIELIASLTDQRDLARAECRAARLYIQRSAESAATGFDSGNLTSIASQCYMAARAANRLEDKSDA